MTPVEAAFLSAIVAGLAKGALAKLDPTVAALVGDLLTPEMIAGVLAKHPDPLAVSKAVLAAEAEYTAVDASIDAQLKAG